MKTLTRFMLAALILAMGQPAAAALKVFACEPEWAALVNELGSAHVTVFTATTPRQDPHRIEARPSLIARLRQADLLVCTGAELESGWLPLLLRKAGNAKVQPGQTGYFEAAAMVERLDVPEKIDRSMGDIHPSGNPHVHTDPRRIAIIADKLSERLASLDPGNAESYRTYHRAYAQRWRNALAAWSKRAQPLKGARMVSHHKDWVYLYDWLGIEDAGKLEPKPGIPATTAHLAALKERLVQRPARAVIRTPYQDPRPSQWLSKQTGLRQVTLPYTVGGTKEAFNLYSLFDDTINRLLTTLP